MENGELRIGEGHFNLSDNSKYVKGAGGIEVKDGLITRLDDQSGHFGPKQADLIRQANLLGDMGIMSPNVDIVSYFF